MPLFREMIVIFPLLEATVFGWIMWCMRNGYVETCILGRVGLFDRGHW